MKAEAILVVIEDYCVLEFYAMWSGRSVAALLMDLLPPSSGQKVIFLKPDKVVQSSG
jgi:hypothetical protein